MECPEPCERTLYGGPMRAFEPAVAVDPTNAANIAVSVELWDEAGVRRIHLVASQDGGATWSTKRLPLGTDVEPTNPLRPCMSSFDPIVAFLADGTLLVGGVADSGDFRDVALYRSTDAGRSLDADPITPGVAQGQFACLPRDASREIGVWPGCIPSSNCIPAGAGRYTDKPFLRAGATGVLLSWANPNTLLRSADAGITWERLDDLSEPRTAYSVDLALASDQAPVVAFSTWVGGDRLLEGAYAARLTEGTWRTTTIDPDGGAYPMIATARDALFVAYPRAKALDDMNIPMVARSDDGGMTWSEPLALDTPEAGGVTLPTLTAGPGGFAFSGFFHHIANGTNEYRVAATDGARVIGPVRVDSTPIGQANLGLSLGHYMGLATTPEGAFAVWIAGEAPDTVLVGAHVRLL